MVDGIHMAGDMRVVELADELGLTMFEILDLCDRIGIDAVNGATELPVRDAARLRRLFGAAEPEPPADTVDAGPTTFPAVGATTAVTAPVLPDAPSSDVDHRTRSDGAGRPVPVRPRDAVPVGAPAAGQDDLADADDADDESTKRSTRKDKKAARALAREDKQARKADEERQREHAEAAKLEAAAETEQSARRLRRSKVADETESAETDERASISAWLRWTVPVAAALVVLVLGAMLLGGGGNAAVAEVSEGEAVPALDVAVGTCFVADDATPLDDVGVVDCTAAHDGEVVAVLQHPARADDPFPGGAALTQDAAERCADAFESYVGEPVGTSSLGLGITHPDENAWERDTERTLVCSVIGVDGMALTQSVAATA